MCVCVRERGGEREPFSLLFLLLIFVNGNSFIIFNLKQRERESMRVYVRERKRVYVRGRESRERKRVCVCV